MTNTGTVIRPEVRLHGRPAVEGNLIRRYGDKNIVCKCVAWGYLVEDEVGPATSGVRGATARRVKD